MKEIPLTQGKVALVDDTDYEQISAFRWHAIQRASGLWYAARNSGRRGHKELMHCVIAQMSRRGLVDHRDGDGLNNTRFNLRPCTASQNQMNRKHNTSAICKFKGIWKTPAGTYQARVETGGRRFFLGTFHSEDEAARAYDAKATELFGEFAHLNFSVPRSNGHD